MFYVSSEKNTRDGHSLQRRLQKERKYILFLDIDNTILEASLNGHEGALAFSQVQLIITTIRNSFALSESSPPLKRTDNEAAASADPALSAAYVTTDLFARVAVEFSDLFSSLDGKLEALSPASANVADDPLSAEAHTCVSRLQSLGLHVPTASADAWVRTLLYYAYLSSRSLTYFYLEKLGYTFVLRPGILSLLPSLSHCALVYVSTKGTREYANAVLRVLDPFRVVVSKTLAREDTTSITETGLESEDTPDIAAVADNTSAEDYSPLAASDTASGAFSSTLVWNQARTFKAVSAFISDNSDVLRRCAIFDNSSIVWTNSRAVDGFIKSIDFYVNPWELAIWMYSDTEAPNGLEYRVTEAFVPRIMQKDVSFSDTVVFYVASRHVQTASLLSAQLRRLHAILHHARCNNTSDIQTHIATLRGQVFRDCVVFIPGMTKETCTLDVDGFVRQRMLVADGNLATDMRVECLNQHGGRVVRKFTSDKYAVTHIWFDISGKGVLEVLAHLQDKIDPEAYRLMNSLAQEHGNDTQTRAIGKGMGLWRCAFFKTLDGYAADSVADSGACSPAVGAAEASSYVSLVDNNWLFSSCYLLSRCSALRSTALFLLTCERTKWFERIAQGNVAGITEMVAKGLSFVGERHPSGHTGIMHGLISYKHASRKTREHFASNFAHMARLLHGEFCQAVVLSTGNDPLPYAVHNKLGEWAVSALLKATAECDLCCSQRSFCDLGAEVQKHYPHLFVKFRSTIAGDPQ